MSTQPISENVFAQITSIMRNITINEVASSVIRIIPDSIDRVTSGLSQFLLINTEKYNDFLSNVGEGDSVTLQLIGLIGYKLYLNHDTIFMHIHLILAAIFPIFIGAHASLSCPSSADKKVPNPTGDEGSDEGEPREVAMETLDKTDALMFPVIAGILLTGLYFLIKWLEDPALLNKLMGWYFSFIGVGAIGKLTADTLNVLTTFIFPSVFFSKGQTYHIDPVLRQQFFDVQGKTDSSAVHRKFRSDESTPLPGLLSDWKLSKKYSSQLWNLRALFTKRWILRAYVREMASFKTHVRLNDVIGLVLGILAIAIYNFGGKPWVLTNLMGFSYCYMAFQLMSPGDFFTGTLLLSGLFFYDIIMVFYSPMMVKVATSLDVPIKLVFPGPKRGSMLGLGDVVLPGIMIALALRFDLYLHYLRKQTKATDNNALPDQHTQPIKAPYVDVTGQWGELFWNRKALKEDRTNTFPKVYFWSAITGYSFGLIVTLLVLNIFNHAQPALLYLVPFVLSAIWGTALLRGEIKLMNSYSEAAPESAGEIETGSESIHDEKQKNTAEIKREEDQPEQPRPVFLFSLSAPRNLKLAPKKKLSEQR